MNAQTPAASDQPQVAGEAQAAAPGASTKGVAAANVHPPSRAPIPDPASDLTLPMRFLVVGLGTLALLALVYPWHIDLLRGSFYIPHLLTFVHVNTLGVIAAVIFGASYQLLPIVLQTPLRSPHVARLSWWLFVPGLVAFVIGMGHGSQELLGAGGVLVYSAVVLYVWVVASTLRVAPHQDVTWWHVAAATGALAVGASLGLLLALSKHVGFLASWTLPTLAAHVLLMLGGWVTPLLTGVAYRLISMFTLTEDHVREDWAFWELWMTAGGAWVVATSLLLGLPQAASAAGALLLLAGLLLFGAQAVRLFRRRVRRATDVHIPFVLVSLMAGVMSAMLLLWGFVTERGPADPIWIVAGWLAIAGWIQTAIQGFLCKIGPFLTWLYRYGPVAGVKRVPMLEQMFSRRLALAGGAFWTTGLILGALTPLTNAEWIPSLAAGCLSLGILAVIANGVRVGRHWLGLARAA